MLDQINQYDWVSGDGGPMIVLQKSVVPLWQGAADFDNSLMCGGTVETDYDIICETGGRITCLHRYGRDLLVLDDSEWGACFVPSGPGKVIVLQAWGWDDDREALVRRMLASPPTETLRLTIEGDTLRLLVGALPGDRSNDGRGGTYGIAEVAVAPGPTLCDVYVSEFGQMAVLRPAPVP